jgi:hypothetical protein
VKVRGVRVAFSRLTPCRVATRGSEGVGLARRPRNFRLFNQ